MHFERNYFNGMNAVPRDGIKEKFEKDCQQLNGSGISVLFSFTGDPYNPSEYIYGLTRWGIETLHRYGLYVNILTKGQGAYRDFHLLTPNDGFACTLTFIDNADSIRWEPKAALPIERITSLREAHEKGVTTWVSLEPVIDPEQTLELIRQTHTFVDSYKVGKLNYSPIAVDWREFAKEVTTLLDSYGNQYYIKEELRKYL
jgi:DNA repair photolyase